MYGGSVCLHAYVTVHHNFGEKEKMYITQLHEILSF